MQHPQLPRVLRADALQQAPRVVVRRAALHDSDGERAAFGCGFVDRDHWHVCVQRYILCVGEGCVYGGGAACVLARGMRTYSAVPFDTGRCVIRSIGILLVIKSRKNNKLQSTQKTHPNVLSV